MTAPLCPACAQAGMVCCPARCVTIAYQHRDWRPEPPRKYAGTGLSGARVLEDLDVEWARERREVGR